MTKKIKTFGLSGKKDILLSQLKINKAMNRRQWIFISLLLAAALTSFAQEASDSYRPFVAEGKQW